MKASELKLLLNKLITNNTNLSAYCEPIIINKQSHTLAQSKILNMDRYVIAKELPYEIK